LSTLPLFTDPSSSAFCPLSLHDALPICLRALEGNPPEELMHATACTSEKHPRSPIGIRGGGPDFIVDRRELQFARVHLHGDLVRDRKSTRLNSSHRTISYAVFCLKKKKK